MKNRDGNDIEDTLPDKLSDLMIVALTDLEKVEKDPRYSVSMIDWHAKSPYDNKCLVCFAGSVLAKSLKFPHRVTTSPDEFDDYEHLGYSRTGKVYEKLFALNSVRCGYISEAIGYIEGEALQEEYGSWISEYATEEDIDANPILQSGGDLEDMSELNREDWKLHMITIIGFLQAEGL